MRLVPVLTVVLASVLAAPDARAFEFGETVGSWINLGDDAPVDPDVRPVTWDDLTPPLSPEQKSAAAELNMRIDQMSDAQISRALELVGSGGSKVIEELDGEKISIMGYLLPLDYESTDAKTFVLVPFIGACVHVPPPPPNQVIYVEYEKGVPMKALEENMWTPFRVTGTLRAVSAMTDLAEVGYQMTAASVKATGG